MNATDKNADMDRMLLGMYFDLPSADVGTFLRAAMRHQQDQNNTEAYEILAQALAAFNSNVCAHLNQFSHLAK